MRSDRDILDSAGEVGQPLVLFLLFVVSGSFLRPYGRIVGAVPKGGPPRINGDIHNRSMRHGFTSHEPRTTSHGFFLGFRCGVPPRQTQTDNDASGNPQRVAGRLSGRPLRYRI